MSEHNEVEIEYRGRCEDGDTVLLQWKTSPETFSFALASLLTSPNWAGLTPLPLVCEMIGNLLEWEHFRPGESNNEFARKMEAAETALIDAISTYQKTMRDERKKLLGLIDGENDNTDTPYDPTEATTRPQNHP